MNGLTRPQLHRILVDRALETGVVIEYDKTFTALDDGPAKVGAVFTDGSAGECETDPTSHPDFDHAGLTQHVLERMVQPI